MVTMLLSLTGRALRLLGTREHSRTELERKLARFEQEPGTLAAALDALQSKGFISEQRVVQSVLNRRSAKLGAARIRQELIGKGLAAQAVQEAVDLLRATEVERAHLVWRKKFGVPAVDANTRAKQARFLASRGFGGEAIRRVVSGGTDDCD